MPRIGEFRELRVYRTAYRLAMRIFVLSRGFPDEERFAMTSQIRRSSRSVATNLAEAWRKRRYPAAFVSKISDAEAEAAETRAHLDFALGCGYIDRDTYEALDGAYARLTKQLVRMISQAPRWTPGRASGRSAGGARVSLTSPSPRARKANEDESPAVGRAGNSPPVGRTESGDQRSPGKKARR